jgi:hypothetical protein
VFRAYPQSLQTTHTTVALKNIINNSLHVTTDSLPIIALSLISLYYIVYVSPAKKKKLRGLSPQANYTDRATAAVGEVVPAFAGRGCYVVSATDPTAVNLGFLDRSRYFFFK